MTSLRNSAVPSNSFPPLKNNFLNYPVWNSAIHCKIITGQRLTNGRFIIHKHRFMIGQPLYYNNLS